MRRIPASDYVLLRRYWDHEPWGAWRDNVHAAILAREIRRPYLKQGARDELDHFMLIDPQTRQRQANRGFLEFMRNIATRKRKKRPINVS